MKDVDLAECQGCQVLGQCCWISVEMGEHDSGRKIRVYSRVPCHKLDTVTGLCTDYKNRLEVPWCRLAGETEADKWPHYCPHHKSKVEAVEGEQLEPIMMLAGRFHQLAAKGERTAAKREEFMKKIDKLAIEEIEEQFDIRLKAHIGSDYKKRQQLREAERKRGPGHRSRERRGDR